MGNVVPPLDRNPKNCYRNSSRLEESQVKTASQRGFTAIELLVAVVVAGLLVVAGVTFAGRRVVDDGEAVKTAAGAGVTEGKVAERHNWLAWRHGCTFVDADSFVVAGKTADGKESSVTVCCDSWFRGCKAAKK